MSSMPPATVAETPAAVKVPRVRGREDRSLLASVALHGTLIVATFIALFPVLWVVLSSLKPKALIQSSEIRLFAEPTLENYRKVLFDTNFPQWFLNSLIVAAFTMVIGIAMSASAGYALSRFNFPGKRGLMWVFLLTQMFPVAILIVPIYTIMAKAGLIDTKASLVIAYCTVAVPFCAWMLRGYFNTIAMSRSLGRRCVTSLSPIRMRPLVTSSSPASMRRLVDLPQPDGPTSTRNSPGSMARSRASTAGFSVPG